jgi:tetratricopeptide (TPR) repeat protein
MMHTAQRTGTVLKGMVIGMAVAAAAGGAWLWMSQTAERGDDPATWSQRTRMTIAQECEAAQTAISSNDLNKARLILDGLVKRFPADPQARVLLAQVMLHDNDAAGALEQLSKSLELNPTQAQVHHTVGIIHEKTGDLSKARHHYTQASMIEPNNASYALYMGQLLMKMGELDEAQMQVLKAQRLDSKLVQSYAVLAEISARRGKVDMAIDLSGKAIDQVAADDPRRVTYTLLKAQYLRRANEPEQALALIESLPAKDRMTEQVVRHTTASLMMMGQAGRAAAVWNDLFTVEPDNAAAAAESGMAWIKAGDMAKARQMLGLATRVNAGDRMVLALRDAVDAQR